jgi:general L-amino acid transport system permease protein
VRTLSVVYIEFIRGVPLITLLFMGFFVLGFLLPPGSAPELVTRALVAITLFEAAYIAEIVRGGLQSVSGGQTEAAQAVGLSPWKTMRLVVLPQALRNTIPAMVGQFISLFKDTSLVAILGLIDLLRLATTANVQPAFLGRGLHAVTLGFAALIFWVGSYTMARESKRIERQLGVGER